MPSTLVTLIRTLHDRKGRRREALALAEGVRLAEEALAAGIPIRGAVVDETVHDARLGALLTLLGERSLPVERVASRVFLDLAATETPQGVILVVEPPVRELAGLDPAAGPILALDAVQDPGNTGTLLRTAWALGAGGAVLLKGTADPFNAKVVRAAMGATFRFPIALADHLAFLSWCAAENLPVWVAATDGTAVRAAPLPARLALVVGNEGAGVSGILVSAAHGRVAIPLARGVESLNVAVAAGILLHEARRAP